VNQGRWLKDFGQAALSPVWASKGRHVCSQPARRAKARHRAPLTACRAGLLACSAILACRSASRRLGVTGSSCFVRWCLFRPCASTNCRFWDRQINMKARRGSIRQCWQGKALHGDSSGGRGLANGALRHGVPGPQEPRCAPSRAPRVWFVMPGVFAVAFLWQGHGRWSWCSKNSDARACIVLLTRSDRPPPLSAKHSSQHTAHPPHCARQTSIPTMVCGGGGGAAALADGGQCFFSGDASHFKHFASHFGATQRRPAGRLWPPCVAKWRRIKLLGTTPRSQILICNFTRDGESEDDEWFPKLGTAPSPSQL